jgi:ELWxxDGT repeat protein
MATHNGELFISAQSRDAGRELWKSTGDRASRLKDINPGSPNVLYNPGSDPNHFKSTGQFLFFSAFNPTNGNELWKTDGTEVGTVLVKDINLNGDSNPDNLENVGSVVLCC